MIASWYGKVNCGPPLKWPHQVSREMFEPDGRSRILSSRALDARRSDRPTSTADRMGSMRLVDRERRRPVGYLSGGLVMDRNQEQENRQMTEGDGENPAVAAASGGGVSRRAVLGSGLAVAATA